MSVKPEEIAFEAALREALSHLYDFPVLRHSPLVQVLGLEKRADTAEALRTALQEAIERLRPAPDTPAETKNLRYYQVLFYRYVQLSTRPNVARRLGLSLRHLSRALHGAIHVLTEQLIAHEAVPERLNLLLSNAALPAALGGQTPLEREMSWLGDSLANQATDVKLALKEVAELAQVLARSHQVTMAMAVSDDLPATAVASTVLRQIVLNLVTTAINSVPGGLLSLTAQLEGGQVAVNIKVLGGIERSGPSLYWGQAGVDMSRRLVELFMGRLIVAEEENALIATIMLPVTMEDLVLGVEDNADTLQLWERYVEGSHFRMVGIREAEQALSTTIRLQPKLILLDVMMPGVDGWELLGQLHNHPAISHIPVVVCTVLPQRELALSLGAGGFIQKPATRREFLAAIEQTVAEARGSAPVSPK